ncbi:MAG: L-serine ammonia-lyase, iron-sulfur-dependent, subunit alpha, partial [Flavobacterium sp.]|nr:L-serine ammonia-lyase, iron-sulfur-dependent, subunit alpha [Flavobacterium sp.]
MEECISVFDMLKIGVGPSSSHTLGPWRAAERFLAECKTENILNQATRVKVDLFGSLSLTGKGHATDYAVMLGLSGQDPETIPVAAIDDIVQSIKSNKKIKLGNELLLDFDIEKDIVFNKNFLPFHANGLTFTLFTSGKEFSETYYSIGGGFVVKEERSNAKIKHQIKCAFPYHTNNADDLLAFCKKENKSISEIVKKKKKSMRSEEQIHNELMRIWHTMLECMYIGCHSEGILPGGLNVRRRAYDMHLGLKGELPYSNPQEWLETIRKTEVKFRQILKWVSCFALAVNEVNAALG